MLDVLLVSTLQMFWNSAVQGFVAVLVLGYSLLSIRCVVDGLDSSCKLFRKISISLVMNSRLRLDYNVQFLNTIS